MRIAIQGELGSFSHEAALGMDPEAVVVPCPLSAIVFDRLAQGEVDAAVIPIENSLAGAVAEHYDLLLQGEVRVDRESLLRISHNLIGIEGSTVDGITQVFSHPIALAQCRRFFAAHPKIEAVPFYDTAGGVKRVIELGKPGAAAIASSRAASIYGGAILQGGIEDSKQNFTRFFLVRRSSDAHQPATENQGRHEEGDSSPRKVSLAFAVANRPGTLVSALQIFATQGLNLTKIESRPVQGYPWQYVFYVDYQLPANTGDGVEWEELRQHCSMVKELGRYPEAELHS